MQEQIHEQQKPGPQLVYTRIRTSKEFTYTVYRCGGCGEHITADNLFIHAAKQHETVDWKTVDPDE